MLATVLNNKKMNNGSFVKRWNAFDEKGIMIILIVICVVLQFLEPRFGSLNNILNMLKQISEISIMAIGVTYLIVCGDIDLSIGSVYGLCMMVAALILKNSIPSIFAILLPIATGMIIGLINGLLVTKVKIPAFIVTLSMLSIARGAVYIMNNGQPISVFPDLENWFFLLGKKIGGVFPIQIIFMIVLYLIAGIVFNKTTFGYKVLATGGNAKTARLSGINVDKVKIASFMIVGMTSAIAAILGLAYMKSVHPTIGVGREMDVIAAVIIGGTALSGGKGTIVGTFIGAAIMGVVRNGMVLLGVQAFYQEALIGLMILLAVIGETWISSRKIKN